MKKNEKTDWLLIESGSETDGSFPTFYRNKTISEMKKIIVEETKNIKKTAECSSFEYGTTAMKDIEERKDPSQNELISLYGYICFSDSHLDIEAHIANKITEM